MAGNTIFTGSSRYSADFQAVVERTVKIASLPLSQMQNALNGLSSRYTALAGLDGKVGALQSAIQSLASGLGQSSFATAVSDYSVVQANTTDGVREGVYSIEVTGFGSNATAVSKPSGGAILNVTDPSTQSLSADLSFSLYLNLDDPIPITPATNSLNALADAINQKACGVQATVVNQGSSDDPDYRLTLRSSEFAENTIQLKDSSENLLLDQPAPGAPVKYKANGGAEVTNSQRSATLAPGLTVNLLKQSAPGVAATVTVTRSASAVRDALTSFVTAYNGVLTELDKNRGAGSGDLKGDSILGTVTGALRQITGYRAGSGIASLNTLGIDIDDKGVMSFKVDKFNSAVGADMNALAGFLGSTAGSGFLKAAADVMSGLEDYSNGILKKSMSGVQAQITEQTRRMETEQDRIDRLRTATEARMAAADALIASLEQQVTYFDNMISAMAAAARNRD